VLIPKIRNTLFGSVTQYNLALVVHTKHNTVQYNTWSYNKTGQISAETWAKLLVCSFFTSFDLLKADISVGGSSLL